MRILFVLSTALLLCSCASGGTFTGMTSMSINGIDYSPPPASIDDPRLISPHVYMDDDSSPAEVAYRPYLR
jgi:hypothetical protein